MGDLAAEALVVAVEAEELVHQVLRQPRELGVVREPARRPATLPGLERRQLVERHGGGGQSIELAMVIVKVL